MTFGARGTTLPSTEIHPSSQAQRPTPRENRCYPAECHESIFLDAVLRLLLAPPAIVVGDSLRSNPLCRPRSELPLRYGTRYITLPHFLRQAVSAFFLSRLSVTFTINTLVSLQQMVRFGQNPGQGTLLNASQFLLGTCHTIHSITSLLIFCTEKRGASCPTRASRQRTR